MVRSVASVVEVWRLLQRLPLKPIVAEYDERSLLALSDREEFSRACDQLFFVLVEGPGFAVRREQALHRNCVDGEQSRSGLREAHED